MLPLDDERWRTYQGGYRGTYYVVPALRSLLENRATDELWEELWTELHHQDDVGSASYAAVPYLLEYARLSPRLDWNVFGLICTIELCRPYGPPIPEEITPGYYAALAELPAIVGAHPDREWDDLVTQCVVACIALARGQRVLGRAYGEMDLKYAKKWLAENVGYEWEWETKP